VNGGTSCPTELCTPALRAEPAAFAALAVLCVAGVAASLARGRVHRSGEPA
jgi:hypothetical protein